LFLLIRTRRYSYPLPYTTLFRSVFDKIAKSNEWGFTTGPITWQNEGFGKKYGEYLSIWKRDRRDRWKIAVRAEIEHPNESREPQDRKSTRLNSSHVKISYAVFCL